MEVREDALELARLVRASADRAVEGKARAAVMFSGGLDSSIIAVLARKRTNIVAYAAGIEGSHDLQWARECAAILDLEFVEIVFTDEDVEASLEEVVGVHGVREPKWMSTFVAHDLAFRGIVEGPVLTGMGADEAFGGYAKYLREPDPDARMAADVGRLLADEHPAYSSMARDHGKELLAPFLDARVLDFASRVPHSRKIGPEGNKLVLREAAKALGVPGMMADREKKAMQYGSGVSKAIKRLLARKGTDMRGLIDSIHA